jgi:hypothetical protein
MVAHVGDNESFLQCFSFCKPPELVSAICGEQDEVPAIQVFAP